MGKLVNYFNWMIACEIRNKADSQTNIFHLFYFLFDGDSDTNILYSFASSFKNFFPSSEPIAKLTSLLSWPGVNLHFTFT